MQEIVLHLLELLQNSLEAVATKITLMIKDDLDHLSQLEKHIEKQVQTIYGGEYS